MSISPSSIPSRRFLLNNFSSQSTIGEWRSSASSSRIFRAYELSDDLTRKQVQVLERRYGGRLRAHAAATRIQRAFREYRMFQQWRSLVVPFQQYTTGIPSYTRSSSSGKNNTAASSSGIPAQATQFRCSAERVNCATAGMSNCWRSKFLTTTSEEANTDASITTTTNCNSNARSTYNNTRKTNVIHDHQHQQMTTIPLLQFPRAPRSSSDISRYASAVGKTASECGVALTATRKGTSQDDSSCLLQSSSYRKHCLNSINNSSISNELIRIRSTQHKTSTTTCKRSDCSNLELVLASTYNNNTASVAATGASVIGTGEGAANRRLIDVTTNVVGYNIEDDQRVHLPCNNNKNNNSHKGNDIMPLRHSDGTSPSVLPNRYHPSVSLSAQLRLNRSAANILVADGINNANANNNNNNNGNNSSSHHKDTLNFTANNTSQELNSSSSTSRLIDAVAATDTCIGSGSSSSSSRRPYIDKMMSPCLSHKRVVPEVAISTNLPSSSAAATQTSSNNNIWVPRSSLCSARSSHTNSLPRLDSHNIKCANMSSDLSVQSEICEQHRRRQYRIALNFFNKKPARGIQLLLNWGFVEENARSIAKLLIGRRGLSKQMIGEYLGHLHDPFHSSVLDHFINEIDLHSMEIDVALRHTLTFFRLPGEAQKIERIVQVFSRRYIICNPERASSFHGADTVFVLSFAIIMLNTDLHSPNIKPSRKMKLEDFIKNLRGIDAGFDLDRCLLTGIYERIREHEFRSGLDHVSQVIKLDHSIVGKDKPKLVEPQRRLVCYCRLNQVVDVNKRQTANAHQRDVFLFNDIFLMTKMVSKKKSTSQYNLRMWSALIGMQISVFQTNFYRFGISIVCQDGEEILLNAKNDDDRYRFVADIRESIAECAEMETIRIECELEKRSNSNSVSAGVLPPQTTQCSSSQNHHHANTLSATNNNMTALTISATGKTLQLNNPSKTATTSQLNKETANNISNCNSTGSVAVQPTDCPLSPCLSPSSTAFQPHHEHATTRNNSLLSSSSFKHHHQQQQHDYVSTGEAQDLFMITSNNQRDSGLPDTASSASAAPVGDNALSAARVSCTSLNDDAVGGVNELLQLLPTTLAGTSSKTFIAINEAAAFDAAGSTYRHNDNHSKHQSFCCCSNSNNTANNHSTVFIVGDVASGSSIVNVATSSMDRGNDISNVNVNNNCVTNSAIISDSNNSSQRRLSFNSLDSGVIE